MAGHHPDRREPDPKTSILLAEHEPEVAEMSARYLRRDGLRVRLVTSPEPTLAELTGGPDGAAVIDLTMPGLDPRRIRRALRTPVIFLVAGGTAPRPRGLAVRRDTAGARRWLARPFSPRQLVVLVREVLCCPRGGRSPPRLPLAFLPGGPIPPDPPWERSRSPQTPSAAPGAPDRNRVRGPRRADGQPRPGPVAAPAARRRGPPGRG